MSSYSPPSENEYQGKLLFSYALPYFSYNNITIKYTNTYRPSIKWKCHWVNLSPESASKCYMVRIKCSGCSYTTECTIIGILWSEKLILNLWSDKPNASLIYVVLLSHCDHINIETLLFGNDDYSYDVNSKMFAKVRTFINQSKRFQQFFTCTSYCLFISVNMLNIYC